MNYCGNEHPKLKKASMTFSGIPARKLRTNRITRQIALIPAMRLDSMMMFKSLSEKILELMATIIVAQFEGLYPFLANLKKL